MTVCVAAICEDDIIIGASDRMITAGDIQFEPPVSKIWRLTNSIAVMTAGDSPTQTAVLHRLQVKVNDILLGRVNQDELDVLEVANLYADSYCDEQAEQAARRYLTPFNLNMEAFLNRQRTFSTRFVEVLSRDVSNFPIPEVETIVCGIDYSGAHLYQLVNEEIIPQDTAGFVAIGAGGWHASSQYMFAGHARNKRFPETLLLTYAAKRRAEVAPGVGEGTDMFFIGPEVGSYMPTGRGVINKLEEIYREIRDKEQEGRIQAVGKVEEYVAEIYRAQDAARAAAEAQKRADAEGSGGHQPDNKERLRDSFGEGESEDTDGDPSES